MTQAVKERTLAEGITAKYELKNEAGKCTITICERDSSGEIISCSHTELENSSGERAYEIFELLYENDVFACHLNDIVQDLMC